MKVTKTNWDEFIVDKKINTKEKQTNYQKYLEHKYLLNRKNLKTPLLKDEKKFFQRESLSIL